MQKKDKECEFVCAAWMQTQNWDAFCVSDKELQYKDIDIICTPRPFGRPMTMSVKLQNASLKYGNFSFEKLLIGKDGTTIPGNFYQCEADYCNISRVVKEGILEVFIWEHQVLKELVPKYCIAEKGLSFQVKATNWYRNYNDAVNMLVPVEKLIEHAIKTVRIPFNVETYKTLAYLKENAKLLISDAYTGIQNINNNKLTQKPSIVIHK